jgi:hypothetical protein
MKGFKDLKKSNKKPAQAVCLRGILVKRTVDTATGEIKVPFRCARLKSGSPSAKEPQDGQQDHGTNQRRDQ